jgi:ankyrin repeat protein
MLEFLLSKANVSEGVDKERWRIAYERIVEGLFGLAKQSPDCLCDHADAINEKVAKWEKSLAGVCSVGQDFQTILFAEELMAIVENPVSPSSKESVEWKRDYAVWATSRMTELLVSIGVHPNWTSDVHHINAGFVAVMTGLGFPVPEAFKDPHAAGEQDKIGRSQAMLAGKFNQVGALLDWVWEGHSLSDTVEVLKSHELATLSPLKMTSMHHRDLLVRAMKHFSLKDFLALSVSSEESPEGIFESLNGQLMSAGFRHGLAGLAAHSGNGEYFAAIQTQGLLPAPQDGFTDDLAGKLLIEYAIWGGNVAIFQAIQTQYGDGFSVCLSKLNARRQAAGQPNLIALAAESGCQAMFDAVVGILPPGSVNAALTYKDRDRETALMRGIRSKNEALAVHIIAMMQANEIRVYDQLNCANNHGQTPLHLAVLENAPKVCTEILRRDDANGTLVTQEIPSSRLSALKLALFERHDEVFRLLISHLVTIRHERLRGRAFYIELIGYAQTAETVLYLVQTAMTQEVTGYNLFEVVKAAIRSGKLDGYQVKEFVKKANDAKLSVDQLYTVYHEAIMSGRLDCEEIMELLTTKYIRQLPTEHLFELHLAAIESGKLGSSEVMSSLMLAMDKGAPGITILRLLPAVVASGKLDATDWMKIAEKAKTCLENKSHSKMEVSQVLQAAIASGKLDATQVMKLVEMATTKKIKGYDLYKVLQAAITLGKLGTNHIKKILDVPLDSLIPLYKSDVFRELIATGNLDAGNTMKLVKQAQSEFQGDHLTKVLQAAIESKELDPSQVDHLSQLIQKQHVGGLTLVAPVRHS